MAAVTDKSKTEYPDCSICLEPIKAKTNVQQEKTTELKCHHFFHNECIQEWLKINSSCPNCRASVSDPAQEESIIDLPDIRSRILEGRRVRVSLLSGTTTVAVTSSKLNVIATRCDFSPS